MTAIAQAFKSSSQWAKFADGSIDKVIKKYSPIGFLRQEVEAAYPYFLIDLSMAIQDGQEEDIIAVVSEGFRRQNLLKSQLGYTTDAQFKVRPGEFKSICGKYLDGEDFSSGYQRAWKQYEYAPDDNFVVEFLWHIHDGYGLPGGTVELWIDLIDKRLLECYEEKENVN